MAQNGRKSAAALSAVTHIPGQRAAPPDELTEEQAVEWRAIVATKPPEWFNRDAQALLVALCRHSGCCPVAAAWNRNPPPVGLTGDLDHELRNASGRQTNNGRVRGWFRQFAAEQGWNRKTPTSGGQGLVEAKAKTSGLIT